MRGVMGEGRGVDASSMLMHLLHAMYVHKPCSPSLLTMLKDILPSRSANKTTPQVALDCSALATDACPLSRAMPLLVHAAQLSSLRRLALSKDMLLVSQLSVDDLSHVPASGCMCSLNTILHCMPEARLCVL